MTGSLDKNSSMQLWQQRKNIISSKINILTFDVSGLSRIDSAGLATIIALIRELNLQQKGFKIQGASQQLRDLAKVNGVLEILPIEP